jgi:hypothetical protein
MASQASPPSPVLYQETQFFPLWSTLIPIGLVTGCLYTAIRFPHEHKVFGWVLCLGVVGFIVVLFLAMLKMVTTLSVDQIQVAFGWFPIYRETIPLHHIQGFEATTYHPIRSYGGWGIRGSRQKGGVLSARGSRGVSLLLDNGKTLIVGSQTPEAFVEALGRSFDAAAQASPNHMA